ncbi:MAG: P-loop NTPase fold protein [Candidatus Micrarchaeota archaeon]
MSTMLINPFSAKHPINPEYFVNRTEILEAFKGDLEFSINASPPKPENVAITGRWGYGKTSLLKKFESIALQDQRVFTAYVEVIPTFCNDFHDFSIRVRDEIERSFKVSSKSLLTKLKSDIIPNWRIKTIDLGLGELERTERGKSHVTTFEDSLIELWKILKQNKIKLMLLMVDDLQYLATAYPDGLYDLRGIFQKLAMDGCNIMLVISGPETLFQIKDFAEPFARFFNRHNLSTFDFTETKKAIVKPIEISSINIKVDEDIIKKIHELTKGHPYFIHFIMHYLVEYRQSGRIDIGFFKDSYEKIAKHLAREKFDYDFMSKATDKEREILLKIAKNPVEIFEPSKIKTPNVRKYLRLLTEKELLIQLERGRYTLYHPLFREYLRSNLTSQ